MMILYSTPTPNGLKVSLMLEECGIPFELRPVDLKQRENKTAEFLELNPNGKIPVLVDGDVVLFESGAILVYLAEKMGQFLSPMGPRRAHELQWLFWQMAQIGPGLGTYFNLKYLIKPREAVAIERAALESQRVLDVADAQLACAPFFAGESYSVADMAILPWIASFLRVEPSWINDRKNLLAWVKRCQARPAVQKIIPMAL